MPVSNLNLARDLLKQIVLLDMMTNKRRRCWIDQTYKICIFPPFERKNHRQEGFAPHKRSSRREARVVPRCKVREMVLSCFIRTEAKEDKQEQQLDDNEQAIQRSSCPGRKVLDEGHDG